MKLAINGFGRIGRLAFQVAVEKGLDVVAINDPFLSPDYMAYMVKYDTVHGRFNGEVSHDDNHIIINGKKTVIYSEMDPVNVPWGKHDIDIVLEC